MADVAFLVYRGSFKADKRKRKDFDGQDNIGAYLVADVLQRAGIPVGFCTPEAASRYRVILISLTSPFDVFHLLQAVAVWQSWQKKRRGFVTVAGGFGLQNVAPIREFVDYAVFGRAESFVSELVKALLAGRDYEHPSVMALREEIRPVTIAQAEIPYPYPVQVGTFVYQEKLIGCPQKCNFCHYSYSRRWLGTGPGDYVLDEQSKGSAESLFLQSAGLVADRPDVGRVITGLDGLSERLRFAFQKRITNDDFVRVIEEASRSCKARAAFYKLYQIGAYPGEPQADLEEFIETVERADPRGKPVKIRVHLTPFYAMPVTPGAWLPVDLSKHYDRRLGGKNIINRENYRVWWAKEIERENTHLAGMVAARATPASDDIISTICFDPRMRKWSGVRRLEHLAKTFDLSPYIREYMTWENLPTWYLSSYQSRDALIRAARRLKNDLGMVEDDQRTETETDRAKRACGQSWEEGTKYPGAQAKQTQAAVP